MKHSNVIRGYYMNLKELHTHTVHQFPCSYCKGRGVDPFGVMSVMSRCTACGGMGSCNILGSFRQCAFCRGTGVSPRSARNPCLACHGRGRSLVMEPTTVCPGCMGNGATKNRVWYCSDCHGLGSISLALK